MWFFWRTNWNKCTAPYKGAGKSTVWLWRISLNRHHKWVWKSFDGQADPKLILELRTNPKFRFRNTFVVAYESVSMKLYYFGLRMKRKREIFYKIHVSSDCEWKEFEKQNYFRIASERNWKCFVNSDCEWVLKQVFQNFDRNRSKLSWKVLNGTDFVLRICLLERCERNYHAHCVIRLTLNCRLE